MKNQNGFTLTEILVSLAITSAALISMMIVWTSIQNMASRGESSLTSGARTVAQIVMEDVVDDVVRGSETISIDSEEYME